MQDDMKKTLSKARLEHACECLKSARILLETNDYKGAANRSYYAIYHAMRSVLALDGIDMRYVLFFLQRAQSDMKAIANASVQSFVSLTVLRYYLFPLPPLTEQKRIVARLEELLPLCERLK